MTPLSQLQSCAPPDMTTVLASSVHDMKNSVSLLISGLEKTLASASPETLATYGELSRMAHEAKRINHGLVRMLTLYKLDQELYPFDPQHVAVDEFLLDIADQASRLLGCRGIDIQLDAPPELYWPYDEDLVAGVIGNAVNNALRFARRHVRLAAGIKDGVLEIRIEDDGPGFPGEMLEAGRPAQGAGAFETGNTGLGLYFSTQVARLHRNRGCRGDIRLENGGAWGGACFVIRLP